MSTIRNILAIPVLAVAALLALLASGLLIAATSVGLLAVAIAPRDER